MIMYIYPYKLMNLIGSGKLECGQVTCHCRHLSSARAELANIALSWTPATRYLV